DPRTGDRLRAPRGGRPARAGGAVQRPAGGGPDRGQRGVPGPDLRLHPPLRPLGLSRLRPGPVSMSVQAEPALQVLVEPAAPPPPEGAAAPAVTVIQPPRGWQLINVRELWQFRELLYFLAWRDVKVRYKQTLLGAAWAVLQPALMMVVFTVFFGRMAGLSSGSLPYPLFAFAGLLPWMFFASATANSGGSVVASER